MAHKIQPGVIASAVAGSRNPDDGAALAATPGRPFDSVD
jgi:hypothetical protein